MLLVLLLLVLCNGMGVVDCDGIVDCIGVRFVLMECFYHRSTSHPIRERLAL